MPLRQKPFVNLWEKEKELVTSIVFLFGNTFKPVLKTTCIKRPAIRDHFSDTKTLLTSTK